MSTTIDNTSPATAPTPALPRRRKLRRTAAALIALAIIAGGATVWAVLRRVPTTAAAAVAPQPTLATVTRQTISAHTQVAGTLSFAGTDTITNRLAGTYTALPPVGRVLRDGSVIYRVNTQPVFLLNGRTPCYRSLSVGDSGPDVKQLNADLVALHLAGNTGLDPTSDQFDWATQYAVEQLQRSKGLTQTGRLDLGQAIFLPGPIRVTAISGRLGVPAAANAPLLTATSTTRIVRVQLDAAQQSTVKVGDRVSITLPDNKTTPGAITRVGTVATSPPATQNGGISPAPLIQVDIRPTDPKATGTLDQAPVQVSITTTFARNAYAVPVTALLALAGGGYGLEAVAPHRLHRIIAVSLGIFDDTTGLVQVTGGGLTAGMRVVTAAS